MGGALEWPSGVWFAFNYYCNRAILVIRAGDGVGHLLYSKEGVTQEYPLAMITYGLGILPIIQDLRSTHSRVAQPWYNDDAGAGGNFAGIRRHIDYLMV